MGQMEAAKERLLAEAKARRETPEFAAAGSKLVAEREAAAAKAEAERKAAAERATLDYWTSRSYAVSPSVLDRHAAGFARTLDAMCQEGAEPDDVAFDAMRSYCHEAFGRYSEKNAATMLELLRTEFGFEVAEGIDWIVATFGGAS